MEISDLNSFSDLLAELKASKRRGAGEYSYNELALKLGFKSPRGLAMVRKCQRAPSASLVRRICDYLALTPQEREFVDWLAERSRLELKGSATASVDLKIEKFKAMRRGPVESAREELPGVRLEIEPSVPEPIRKRLEDCVRELAFEFGEIRKHRLATEDTASATDPRAGCPRDDDKDPGGEDSAPAADRK